MTTLILPARLPRRLASSLTPSNADGVQARFALRITSVLNEGACNLPHDVSERLRFSREKALESARLSVSPARVAAAGLRRIQGKGALTWGSGAGGLSGRQRGWWLRLAAVLPLAALLAGLVLIQDMHVDSQISAAAEVDSELLADELPPTAYADPGFVEFLKTPAN